MLHFAYGSNLDKDDMAKKDVRFAFVDLAWVDGWRLSFHYRSEGRKGGALDIVRAEGTVAGALLDIEESSVDALDEKEGCPTYYQRLELDVRDASGRVRRATTYVVNPACANDEKQFVPPAVAYLEVVRRGMRALGVEGIEALDTAARGEPDDLSRADAAREAPREG